MKKVILICLLFCTFSKGNCQNLRESLETIIKAGVYVSADLKSNNTLSRLTGIWSKYQILYPSGRKEWVPHDQRVTIYITPDFSDSNSLMHYAYFTPNESSPTEEGILWFGFEGTMCLGAQYNPYAMGLEFKFGIFERGMECLMIKALLLSNENTGLFLDEISSEGYRCLRKELVRSFL